MLMTEHDWPVHVLTRRHSSRLPQVQPHDIVDGIPLTRLYSRGNYKIGALLYMLGGLWYLLRHGRGEIYHAHGVGAPAWMAVLARYLLGGRCLIKLRIGRYVYSKQLASWFGRWIFLTLLRLADRVIVVNREVEQLLREFEISSTVVRIPNGVDTSVFKAATRDKVSIRKQLNLGTDNTLLLYVGRLNLATKDIDTLIHAWNILPKEVRSRAQLVLVGSGPDHQKLAGMISSLDIEDSVLMVGEKQEVRDYYWASDIFVLPSRDEGLSNALLEAMACELPVIASSVGGTPDIVGDCDNGFLYEAGNDKQLAEKIIQALGMEEEWAAIGARGRETVLRTADIVLVAEQLDAVYQSLRASLNDN